MDYVKNITDAVGNYYHYNPDTLMPLLMVALAKRGELNLKEYKEEHTVRYPICQLVPSEIRHYDWVRLDDKLKERVEKWIEEGVKLVSFEMEVSRSLLRIYDTFKKNDEIDVVQEHHHRMGLLVHHSSTENEDKACRQYATFILAETLVETPKKTLDECYFQIYNQILEGSGLQPKRPRVKVAKALTSLLDYGGEGLVYNPFAGCAIAGAMIGSRKNYYGDGDSNDKTYAAALLLNYGMGVSNEHFIQRNSKEWLDKEKIDYVVSTYTGNINGQSAFDFCLGKCLQDDQFKGKYAGMVLPKEIFEHPTPNFKEALERDWIETIVLMNFGEVAVLVNANKPESSHGVIRFIDGNGPLSQKTEICELIENPAYSLIVQNSDAKVEGYLKSLLAKDKQFEEKKFVKLNELVEAIPRKVYDFNRFVKSRKVLAYIDRDSQNYGGWNPMIKIKPFDHLYGPVYRLKGECIIVNASGEAQPQACYFDRPQFFQEGFAFKVKEGVDTLWLADELNETYVRNQLHPYGCNPMVPEVLTEDDYLNLSILKPLSEEEIEENERIEKLAEEENRRKRIQCQVLKNGTVLIHDKKRYEIIKFEGNGSFGFTYFAKMQDLENGVEEDVAIKEFFPNDQMWRDKDGLRAMYEPISKTNLDRYRNDFIREADILKRMNDVSSGRVAEFKASFHDDRTDTEYYVMKYYKRHTLEDMINAGNVPQSEELIINNIIVPVCQGLQALHSQRILHLDIKPDNIVIDDDDKAVLIDFSTAVEFDENDNNLLRDRTPSGSDYSAPESKDGPLTKFWPRADIFGAACTFYRLFSDYFMYPINSNYDRNVMAESMHCSEQTKNAILKGMYFFSDNRQADVQEFLNGFRGCEEIVL